MTNRDWYLHVKSSTKYRYVRYKISDLPVRYSMFRHLHRIAHLSDVICAIPGCTQTKTERKRLRYTDRNRRIEREREREVLRERERVGGGGGGKEEEADKQTD